MTGVEAMPDSCQSTW